ncbi:MAG: zinc-ribbon domain-containing protein [Ruminococcus sp.]
MFCEKCGNKMNEGEKFCEKCGTPVSTPVVNTENAPAQEVVNNTAPQANTAVNNATPQPVTAPKPPRQPMSPKAKKAIMFSSIGAGVVVITLIVLFAFVLPMLNRVKVQEFIKVDFNEDMLYEGHASATFSIDGTEIYDKYLSDGKSAKEKLDKYNNIDDIGSLLSAYGSSLSDELSNSGISTILENCDVWVEVKGASEKTEETETTEEYDSKYDTHTSSTVSNLKGDEVVVVKLIWDKDEDSIKEIKRAEKVAGISFDTTDTTVEIKIADELKKDDLTLEKIQEVDILDYIAENNLAGTKGIKEGDLSFCINGFEYEVGDHKLVFEPSNYYGIGNVYALEKDETLDDYTSSYGSVELLSDNSISSLSTGDNVTLNVVSHHFPGTNIFITESSKTFEIKANEPLDTVTAKNNIDKIKTAAEVNFEEEDNVAIVNVYLLDKKSDGAEYENKVVVVYSYDTTDIWGKKVKKYNTITFGNAYMDGDNLACSSKDTGWWSYSSLKDLEEQNGNLNDDNYTKVKIS